MCRDLRLPMPAHFPHNGVIWELNYRGELPFLHQAQKQSQSRSLIVVNGWDYF